MTLDIHTVSSVPDASIGAQQLLQEFAVYGRFYERPICGKNEQLRDRLEIAPRPWPLQRVLQNPPDLMVIMMNPGGSRPLSALWDAGAHQGFVVAMPDRTQYQIMRMLLAAQRLGLPWWHARIFNLSDLRTPKSALMLQKIKAYQTDDSHSLFSKQRKKECSHYFELNSTPVLCAWGLNPQLNMNAELALSAIQGHPLLGITADGILYRHPLPQRHDLQLQWLSQIEAQMKLLNTSKVQ